MQFTARHHFGAGSPHASVEYLLDCCVAYPCVRPEYREVAMSIFSPASVADPWLAANGSKKTPVGDLWHMALINPVVLGVAKHVAAGINPFRPVSLYSEMVNQRRHLGAATSDVTTRNDGLLRWHRLAVEDSHLLDGVRILDLGCGEGYLGRWLSHAGAAYAGIDAASRLVRAPTSSRSSAASKASCRLVKGDLSKDAEDIASFIRKHDLSEPTLVTAIDSLDHMPNPMRLLKNLSAYLGGLATPAPLLVVTLNPRLYDKSPEDNCDIVPITSTEIVGTLRDVTIASTGVRVTPCFRSIREWEAIFRECGFQQLSAAPLQFSAHQLCPEDAATSISLNIAPFHAWLLYPHGRRSTATSETLRTLRKIEGSPFAQVGSAEWERVSSVLTQKLPSLSVIEYRKNAPIMLPHSPGGDVFVVLDGQAALLGHRDQVLLPLGPGAVFGELEFYAGSGVRDAASFWISRYVLPVRAEADATRCLLIPRLVFEDVLNGISSPLSARLFSTLGRRVLVDYWLTRQPFRSDGAERTRLERLSSSDKNALVKKNAESLNRTAAALLYCSAYEASDNSRPHTNGSTLFIGPMELGQLAGIEPQTMMKHLAALSAARVIDWLSSTKKNVAAEPALQASVTSFWKEAVAASSALAAIKGNTTGLEAIRRQLIETGAGKALLRSATSKSDADDSSDGADETVLAMLPGFVTNYVQKLRTDPEARAGEIRCLAKWLARLGYVQKYFLGAKNGSVIRIVDLHALRVVAARDGANENLFLDRYEAFPDRTANANGVLEDEWVPTALHALEKVAYFETARHFFNGGWKADSHVEMTASPNLRHQHYQRYRPYMTCAAIEELFVEQLQEL